MLYMIFQYGSNPADIDRFSSQTGKKIIMSKKKFHLQYLFSDFGMHENLHGHTHMHKHTQTLHTQNPHTDTQKLVGMSTQIII